MQFCSQIGALLAAFGAFEARAEAADAEGGEVVVRALPLLERNFGLRHGDFGREVDRRPRAFARTADGMLASDACFL